MQMRTMVSEEKSMNIDDTVLVADGAKIVGEDLSSGKRPQIVPTKYHKLLRQNTANYSDKIQQIGPMIYEKPYRSFDSGCRNGGLRFTSLP